MPICTSSALRCSRTVQTVKIIAQAAIANAETVTRSCITEVIGCGCIVIFPKSDSFRLGASNFHLAASIIVETGPHLSTLALRPPPAAARRVVIARSAATKQSSRPVDCFPLRLRLAVAMTGRSPPQRRRRRLTPDLHKGPATRDCLLRSASAFSCASRP